LGEPAEIRQLHQSLVNAGEASRPSSFIHCLKLFSTGVRLEANGANCWPRHDVAPPRDLIWSIFRDYLYNDGAKGTTTTKFDLGSLLRFLANRRLCLSLIAFHDVAAYERLPGNPIITASLGQMTEVTKVWFHFETFFALITHTLSSSYQICIVWQIIKFV
jgi:hypothetical protein